MKLPLQFIYNIQSVAKYESKLLLRSWFFKIFMILAIFVLTIFNLSVLVLTDIGYYVNPWLLKAVSANIPYVNILLLNIGQAVVAIFLASDFLKRDKQLDTSEVFYVRPLSNAEYVFGKIWGNLKVFLLLSIVIIGITLALNLVSENTSVDWAAYGTYFLIITIPTLVYIMGLATFLMLTLKNQALTFIILLGYIGVTIFYISDKFYYIFDYMAYSLPLFKSSIVGFSDLALVLNHRAIYLFFGLGFIFFTIFLFRRLPNSSRGHYPWIALSFVFFGIGILSAYNHANSTISQDVRRAVFVKLNNEYVHSPRMLIDQYKLSVKQNPNSIDVVAEVTGVAQDTTNVLTFTLNPGLVIEQITQNDSSLNFERKEQILLVDFGKEIYPSDTLTLSIKYSGDIDEAMCYLDIPEDQLREGNSSFMINIGKKYSFITEDYLMLTPETFWYPKPGTAFSDESPDWQQTYFTNFTIEVDPIEGLTPVSQGIMSKDSLTGKFLFKPDYLAQTISLLIGEYKSKSILSDSVTYSVHYLEGHDYFSHIFDSIHDTIPTLIRDQRGNLERRYKFKYPFDRFSLVEVPGQFKGFTRAWTRAQESVQPEMIFVPEKGFLGWDFDILSNFEDQFMYAKWRGKEINDKEAAIGVFRDLGWTFYGSGGNYSRNEGARGREEIRITGGNPYFIFPLLFNFKYNIYSSQWPIANRAIELYVLDEVNSSGWTRNYNGISDGEKANLLMRDTPIKELLADEEYRYLTDQFIMLRTSNLFTEAEIGAGVKVLRDSLFSILEKNTFKNLKFEDLLDTLGVIGKADIHESLKKWDSVTPLPRYTIGTPEVKHIKNPDKEIFVFAIEVSNDSDNEGIINVDMYIPGPPSSDPKQKRKIVFAPRESKRIVSHWETAPRGVRINTLISENLPSYIYQYFNDVERLRNVTIEPEGDFTITRDSIDNSGEIIVDNEDSTRFSTTAPEPIGLLPGWLDFIENDTFKYHGLTWNAPLKWTATTAVSYYGKYIRSALVIKSGDGSQTATWKVPIEEEGKYDVYYHYTMDRYSWYWRSGEYLFTIKYGDEIEDAYINIRSADNGWEKLGVYDLKPGVVEVTLNNKSESRSVIADAVKFVKR